MTVWVMLSVCFVSLLIYVGFVVFASCVGEWLDILWCSVCLSLSFVTFFVKKYFFSAYQL